MAADGVKAAELKSWNDGLFECFNDIPIFAIGCLAPCVIYGQNVEKLGQGSFISGFAMYACCGCIACLFAGPTRTALRNKYGLKEEPIPDFLVHWCCSPCGVCQEARQLAKSA